MFDKRIAQFIFTVLAFAAGLGFLYLTRKTLIIFLFAILFAYLLEPVVARLERLTRNSRPLAIAATYLALIAVLVGVGFLIGPRIVSEVRRLGQLLPDLFQRISSGNIVWQVGAQRGWSYETQRELQDFLAGHRAQLIDFISSMGQRLALVATNAGWVVLIPILSVFFLAKNSQLKLLAAGTLEGGAEDRKIYLLQQVLHDLDIMLSQFVRAQLLLVVISAVAYTLGLALLRTQYAFALGAIGGLLEFVPLVGPLLAAMVILGINFSLSYPHLLLIVLFLGVWRICIDYVISPRVLGGKVEISPLMAIFGVLAGGEVAGVIGIYLATPTLAAIRILWKHWRAYSHAREQTRHETIRER